jgi:hypothetical protein
MEEKTPIIILAAVFAVAVVGFILYFSTANTGMFNVYGSGEATSIQHARTVIDARTRAAAATYGEAKYVDEQTGEVREDVGNLQFVIKSDWQPKQSATRSPGEIESLCFAFDPATGEIMETRPGRNRPGPAARRLMEQGTACYQKGQYILTNGAGISSSVADIPPWDYCCYDDLTGSTY